MVVLAFFISGSPHGYDAYGLVTKRVNRSPKNPIQLGDDGIPTLARGARWNHQALLVKPEKARAIKVDPVLLGVGMAFLRIILEIHLMDNIYTIIDVKRVIFAPPPPPT